MILADKIIDLRKKNGWSQEELAEKLGVSRQAVSKWEGAQSVPDMTRVLQMSELFGVSTDYLLKDSLEMAEPAEDAPSDSLPIRTVGMEEANAFLAAREVNARHIALGVLLCILSPVCLILLCGAQEFDYVPLSEAGAAGIGVAVDGMARERREQFRPTRDRQLTLGIVLCVLAVIPVFLSLVLYGEGDHFGHLVAVALLLVLAGIGVLLIVRSSILWGSYQRLLEEGDYSRAGKEASRVAAPFNSIYWGLVTAGFLAWGFLGNAWDRCWMVWPVAAVAYGAIYGIVRALRH